MAILSSIPNWRITLNRDVVPGESALRVGDFTPVITDISGTGLIRDIVLDTPRTTSTGFLTSSDITISNHATDPAMVVTSVAPSGLILSALDQIRQLLDVGLTSTQLPNAVIYSSVYLRKGEREVYESTGESDSTYNRLSPDKKENFRIATMYRTAALLVPALPDIVEQSTLRLRTRYVEIDWQEKIALFLKLADEVIEDDIVRPQITAAVVAESITRTVRF